MTDPKAARPDESRDPLVEMSIERVRRADGRSLIYFSWPHEQAAGVDADPPESSTAEQPDV